MKTERIVGWDGKLIGLSLHKRRTAKVDLCWFGLDKIHVPSITPTATQLRRTSKETRSMLTTPVSEWEIQHQDTPCQYQDTVELQEILLPTTINGAKFTTRGQDNDD